MQFLPKKDFYLTLPHHSQPALDLEGELLSGEHTLRNRVEEKTELKEMLKVQNELTAKRNKQLISKYTGILVLKPYGQDSLYSQSAIAPKDLMYQVI